MKTLLLIAQSAFTPFILLAQEQVFTYSKVNHEPHFTSDATNIAFEESKKTKEGTVERLVTINDGRYTLTTKKTVEGKVQEITDSTGGKQATVLLERSDRYSILLPDKELLKYRRIDKYNWVYQREGKDIVTAAYRKVRGKKQITIQSSELTGPIVELIQITAMERGSDIIGSSTQTGTMIAVAAGLALLRIATSSANQSNKMV